MKKPSFIFTRSKFGLDISVWLTMLLVFVLALGMLSFKIITKTNCTEFEISASGLRQPSNNIFYIGESITFSIPNQKTNRIEWDFGDNTKIVKGDKFIQHSFLKEGTYTITCIVNKTCEQFLAINISSNSSKIIIDTNNYISKGPAILGRDTVYAGDDVHYLTTLKSTYNNYQWTVPTSPAMPAQTKIDAVFIFNKEGKQRLQLRIDDNKIYTKDIIVLAKHTSNIGLTPTSTEFKIPPAIQSVTPVSGGPGTSVTITGSFLGNTKSVSFGGIEAKFAVVSSTEVTAIVSDGSQTGPVAIVTDNGSTTFANPPFTYIAPKVDNNTSTPSTTTSTDETSLIGISDKTLTHMLVQVTNNAMHVQDFDKYFYSKGNTIVYENNDSKPSNFSTLCQKLTTLGNKVIIDSVKISRDPDNTKHIVSINVYYNAGSKQGWIDKLIHGKKKN